jgi:hypothetical protein
MRKKDNTEWIGIQASNIFNIGNPGDGKSGFNRFCEYINVSLIVYILKI